jgi:hypothetical protein
MGDVVGNTTHLQIDWGEISAGTDHDAGDTEIKIISKWRESQIAKVNNTMKSLETRTKLLITNQNAIIGEIARLDVKTADSFDSNKDSGSMRKSLVLVLRKNAIIGANKSPKVLLVFMEALNTFFDQNPGKYALLRNRLLLSSALTVSYYMPE